MKMGKVAGVRFWKAARKSKNRSREGYFLAFLGCMLCGN